MKSLKQRRCGFTLVEVMAVIAIIMSLTAMLLPAFVGARASSKATVCVSNLHQIGLATNLYNADYDDLYPKLVNAFERYDPYFRVGRAKTDDPNQFPTPADTIGPYSNDYQIFICLLDRGAEFPGNPKTFTSYPYFYTKNGGVSYLFAELFNGQTTSSWNDPGNSIWACDAYPAWHSPEFDVHSISSGAVTALFYDIHVRVVRNRNSPTFLE